MTSSGRARPLKAMISNTRTPCPTPSAAAHPHLTRSGPYPAISPDGRHIVFVGENVSGEPAGHRAIFTVDMNGRHLHRITPLEDGCR
jgi:hypothetical protein